MLVNFTYPLIKQRNLSAPRPFITIEYIMINKINDFEKNAFELIKLLDKKI